MREPFDVVQGLRAGLAVFARRRDEVLRVAYTRELRQELADLLRGCASAGIPCEESSPAVLDRLAGGAHHEGL